LAILGLPAGITWTKSSNTLPGSGFGCVLFSGTTSDSAGTYRLNAIGKIWAHLNVPPLINNVDTNSYGSLNRLPAYSNYYLVVDSAPTPLSARINSRVSCATAGSGSATVTASGGSPTDPYSYLWSTGVTSYTINNVAAGTYYVTVSSGIDTVMDTVNVVVEPSAVAATVASQTPDSNSVNAIGSATISVTGGTPPYTYTWNNGDSTATITGLAPGTYRVTVRDSLGCRANTQVVIPNLSAGIANTSMVAAQLSVYPNPAKNQLNMLIESSVAISGKIEATDITGKVVYSAPVNISNARYSQVLDISKFSAGVYILQLTSEGQSIHQRFVVAK